MNSFFNPTKLNITMRSTLARAYLKYQKFKNRIILNHFPTQLNLKPGTATAFADHREKIAELCKLVNRDYCVLDLPNYANIGDHMIYEGSLQFLNNLPYQKQYEACVDSFHKSGINDNDIIIMQGGGNFGDLWSRHQHFREWIITSFTKNTIIIFPQTIYFQDPENLKKAVSVFSRHPDLTLCVRDQRSYEIATNNFTKNTVLLLPDMASHIQYGLVKKSRKSISRVLLMQRKDKELEKSMSIPFVRNLEVKDWPTYDYNYYNYLRSKYKQHIFYLHVGLLFMANYDLVITTRLHGGIMSTLLGIPTIFLDNSYGKNSTYYNTWLKDMPDCYFAYNRDKLKKLVKEQFPEIMK